MQRMTLTFLLGFGLTLGACDSDGDGGETDSGTDGASSSTSSASDTASASDSDTASDSDSGSDSDSNSGPDSTSSSGGEEGSSGGSTGGGSSSGGFGSSSSGGFGSSSTGGDDGGIYGPCPGDQACEGDLECQQIGGGPNEGVNWCTQACDVEAQDCPPPSEGDAEATCRGAGGGGDSICVLGCTQETTCPTGMECIAVGGGGGGGGMGICAFPADF